MERERRRGNLVSSDICFYPQPSGLPKREKGWWRLGETRSRSCFSGPKSNPFLFQRLADVLKRIRKGRRGKQHEEVSAHLWGISREKTA